MKSNEKTKIDGWAVACFASSLLINIALLSICAKGVFDYGISISSLEAQIVKILTYSCIVSVFFGIFSLTRIKKQQIRGKEQAQVGLGLAFLFLLIAVIILPNCYHTGEPAPFTACSSNIKNLGTALEMYAEDNSGRFPNSLSKLVPEYLKYLPKCPGAGKDTYSESYISRTKPDYFKLYCSGNYHKKCNVPPNYPQYDSGKGLIIGH